jgi:peptidoglycan hydrolase CwlO-like protein
MKGNTKKETILARLDDELSEWENKKDQAKQDLNRINRRIKRIYEKMDEANQ